MADAFERIPEVQSLMATRVADALLAVDKELYGLPYRSIGGLPLVERESVFGVVNTVARKALGDGWPKLLALAVDRQRAATALQPYGPGNAQCSAEDATGLGCAGPVGHPDGSDHANINGRLPHA